MPVGTGTEIPFKIELVSQINLIKLYVTFHEVKLIKKDITALLFLL